jgi:glycosyltransferase involved in cell wall biosynthesis
MLQKTRILSVIDGLGFAGDESRLLSFSRTLDRDRFAHSVLTLNPAAYTSAKEFYARRDQYLKAGVEVNDLSEVSPEPWPCPPGVPRKLYQKTGILRRSLRLAGVVRGWNVQVLDGHLLSAGLISVLAGRITGTASSITLYGGSGIGNRVIEPLSMRVALRLATGVLTDSRVRADEMKALIPKQASKVAVIPNGVPGLHSKRTSSEMRHFLGLPENPAIRIVGMVARFQKYKGHDVFLAAAHKVLERQPNTAFLAVGFTPSEPYRDSLKQLAERLGIAERVVLAEYPGDIADVWNVIDIHAHTSLFDSLPISIAEGMSLAKPAVVTSAGGIPEIVQHNKTGLVVPPGDPNAFADALLELLSKPELGRALGENARHRYEELYQPETMARAMENYFLQITMRVNEFRDRSDRRG